MSTPVVLLGANGGLGRRIQARLAGHREIVLVDRDLDPSHDLADPDSVQRLCDALPQRVIAINAAGMVTTSHSAADIAAMVRSNVQAPASLTSGLAGKLEHLIHLSSVSVYGSRATNPIGESHDLAPDTAYGSTKHAAEQLLRVLCREANVPLTVFRSTQLVALASAHTAFPHSIVSRLRRGERPTLTVDPATRRDYLHVDDAADLVVHSALAPTVGTFNMGSGDGIRLGDLLQAAYES